MKSISATDARKNWFELIQQAGKPGVIVNINHRDLPNVVLMSAEEFDGWQETMEIMANPIVMNHIQKGLQEIQSKKTVQLDSVKKKLKL